MHKRFATVLGGLVFATVALNTAQAMPFDPSLSLSRPDLTPVRLVCDYNRCIDTRTGAYTQSRCYRGACRPGSGVVGYANPRRVLGDDAGPRTSFGSRRYYERPRYYDDYRRPSRPTVYFRF
jgi:hypothetical protein